MELYICYIKEDNAYLFGYTSSHFLTNTSKYDVLIIYTHKYIYTNIHTHMLLKMINYTS